MKDWRLYERFIAGLMSEQSSDEITVIPNARIRGAISGTIRQIDVLIDSRHDEEISRRVIIDAKRYRNKVDVKDVESFEGMMKDCRAHHGVLVCPNGYTPAALRRAQNAITIRLVPLNELEKLDLGVWDCCAGACRTERRRGAEPGLVLWDSPYGLAVKDSPLHIMAIGKCDVCNNFHVWCWVCGAKFALKDEDEHKCSCPWFWLTAIEDEVDDSNTRPIKAVHLLLILPVGLDLPGFGMVAVQPMVLHVDRRPLQ
ncbi:MAG TPA: restriction endonuclease [Blastocatellia bacterium]|nr:restriction endonuclease [Blastocatellia bacterium]